MATVKPIREGFHSITPILTVKDGARAIDFYQKALGAKLLYKMDNPDGKVMHAELQIGDSRIMLGEESPESGSLAPSSQNAHCGATYLYVEDVDTVFENAVRAGAKVEMPLSDQFWGDRTGLVVDPSGNRWFLATHVKDLTPEEIRQAADAHFASMQH